MAMGCVNVSVGNTRCTASDRLLLGASPARQEVFEGRLSSPLPGVDPLVVALAAAEGAEVLAGVAPSTATTV